MKRSISFLFCLTLLTTGIFAQTGFSYQAVIRQADGTIRANETINLTAELLQSDITVYSETHVAQTNEYGAFTITIGEGATGQTYTPSIFLNTDSTATLQTVLKITEEGGNILSKTDILGVPFAEVAKVALTAHVDFPPGVIMPFAGPADKIPAGWMLCNGDSLNKADYPELFSVIGTNWGEPTPSSFSLPDLRGVFLRGVSGESDDLFSDPDKATRIARNSGGNTGPVVGSYQSDEFRSHTHSNKTAFIVNGAAGRYSGGDWGAFSQDPAINSSGGNETRPVNAYVNYIIKY